MSQNKWQLLINGVRGREQVSVFNNGAGQLHSIPKAFVQACASGELLCIDLQVVANNEVRILRGGRVDFTIPLSLLKQLVGARDEVTETSS